MSTNLIEPIDLNPGLPQQGPLVNLGVPMDRAAVR